MSTAKRLDPTIYPESDYMGEGELQQLINELLRPLLARYFVERGKVAHVGSNTFLYYVRHDSSQRIAPDVYVLPGAPQAAIQKSWKLFDLDLAPSFALEVVSTHIEKDYAEAPLIHAAIGTKELVIFDPGARGRKDRFVWQHHRRVRGAFVATRTDADRIRSPELGCFLRVVGRGDAQRVRLATGPRGDDLYPTEAEAERAAKESAISAKESAVAEMESAVAEMESAVAERERAIAAKDRAFAERASAVADRERAIAEREAAVARIAQLEAELARRGR